MNQEASAVCGASASGSSLDSSRAQRAQSARRESLLIYLPDRPGFVSHLVRAT